MTEIYDIVLNFCNSSEQVYEFFEWHKQDKLTYINKIPIVKINSFQMNDINNNIIKIDDSLLLRIKNKTTTDTMIIPYCLLVTDSNKVIALSFNKKGILEKRSSLLLDEEEAVIEETESINLELLELEIISPIKKELFLTRKENKIKNILLKTITQLYKEKSYDEIDYLYQEIFQTKKTLKEEYNSLKEEITNNFNNNFYKLYDIIKLTVNNNST